MAEDINTHSAERNQRDKPGPALKILLVLFVIAIFLVVALVYVVLKQFQAGIGINSILIADYPAVQSHVIQAYPTSARFLPEAIPDNATIIVFHGSTSEMMQASSFLCVSFILNQNDAQAELVRLRSFSPTSENTNTQLSVFCNTINQSMLSSTIEFRFDNPTRPEILGHALFDPNTNQFWYEVKNTH